MAHGGSRACSDSPGVVQIGWAFVSWHVQSKAPNNYGVNVVGLNPLGMEALPGRVIVGNALIELGLVMGVFSAQDMLNVPFGETLPLRERAKEWCVVCCRPPCMCP